MLTAVDLATYDAEWVAPLSTTYRGWTVYELPPNGQGIAALMMLNLIEQSPMGSYGHNSAEALHTLIEAKKLAYADIIPGFMTGGDTKVAFGIMGGWNQSQAHAQFVSNVVDHGMNIQAALERRA